MCCVVRAVLRVAWWCRVGQVDVRHVGRWHDGTMGGWVVLGFARRRRATASDVADDVRPCVSRKGGWKCGWYDACCECRCKGTEVARINRWEECRWMSLDGERIKRLVLRMLWSRLRSRTARGEFMYPHSHVSSCPARGSHRVTSPETSQNSQDEKAVKSKEVTSEAQKRDCEDLP